MEKTNKLTSKKLITILVAVFAVCVVALGILAFARNYVNEIATEKKYEYYNPDETKAKTDEGFKIDGVLDEEIYQKCTWLYARNIKGDAFVDLAMTSYYGDKGMYYVYDVTESTTIYVNPERSKYCNSSIEMYLAPDEASNLRYNNTYEMHLLPTGEIGVYRSSGSGGFTRGEAQDEFMPCLGATTKGGKVNDPDCHGYYLELFIPWEYYESQGSDLEEVKSNYMYINPAHITSYNESGTDLNGDRFWYAFATQLGGDGWSDVTKYFKFDGQGLVGSVPITYEKEEHCTITGSKTIIPGMKAYVTITPEEGYALNSILVNGEEQIKKVSYNEDGSVTLALKSKGEPITISASAEKITAGNKTLRGIVYPHKLGGDNLNEVEISYKGPNGEKPITLDANGAFELKDLKQGYYTITVSKKGYQKLVRGISLKRDIDTELWLEYDLLAKESGTCWDIEEQNDGILNSIGGNGILLTKDSYNKFSVEGNFRFDESIKDLAEHDFYEQQRIGLRIKFSNGKYWHVDVLQQKGKYLVQYAELTGKDSIYSWTGIYTMTDAEITKYRSVDGINLKVVRDGQYANVYLDNKFIAAEDFGADYKNLTAQVGFESYAACDGVSTVKFDIKTNNVKVQKTPYFSRSGGWDISKQFQGLVTLPNGGHNAKLKFSQKYTDMDLTLTVRDYANGKDDTTTDSPRTDVKFIFEDGKELTFGILQRKNNGKVIIQSMADSKKTITGWTTQYTLTEDEVALFKGDGVNFRIVRIGTEFALYIGDKMVKVCDFEGKISAGTKADIYLRHWGDEGVDVQIPFSMKTNLNKVSITDVGSKNGKVVGQKKTYLVGDTVVLVGQSEAYYCNAMSIDGQAVTMNDDATYRFVATKNSYNVQGNFVKKTFVDNYSWNLLKQNEGLITLPDGGDNFGLKFYEKYTDMDLTLTVRDYAKGNDDATTDSPRTDVKFIFEDGKELTFGVLQRKNNGKVIIQSMADSKNTITGWTTQYTLTDDEVALFKGDGVHFRIVRIGTEFALYIGGKMVKLCDFDGKISADTKADIYLRHWGDKGVDVDIPFHITANLDKVTITDGGSENGKVVGKRKTYLIGDTVVLSSKGDEGYYCSSIKVDGDAVEVTTDGTYTFVATKRTYTVEGIFQSKALDKSFTEFVEYISVPDQNTANDVIANMIDDYQRNYVYQLNFKYAGLSSAGNDDSKACARVLFDMAIDGDSTPPVYRVGLYKNAEGCYLKADIYNDNPDSGFTATTFNLTAKQIAKIESSTGLNIFFVQTGEATYTLYVEEGATHTVKHVPNSTYTYEGADSVVRYRSGSQTGATPTIVTKGYFYGYGYTTGEDVANALLDSISVEPYEKIVQYTTTQAFFEDAIMNRMKATGDYFLFQANMKLAGFSTMEESTNAHIRVLFDLPGKGKTPVYRVMLYKENGKSLLKINIHNDDSFKTVTKELTAEQVAKIEGNSGLNVFFVQTGEEAYTLYVEAGDTKTVEKVEGSTYTYQGSNHVSQYRYDTKTGKNPTVVTTGYFYKQSEIEGAQLANTLLGNISEEQYEKIVQYTTTQVLLEDAIMNRMKATGDYFLFQANMKLAGFSTMEESTNAHIRVLFDLPGIGKTPVYRVMLYKENGKSLLKINIHNDDSFKTVTKELTAEQVAKIEGDSGLNVFFVQTGEEAYTLYVEAGDTKTVEKVEGSTYTYQGSNHVSQYRYDTKTGKNPTVVTTGYFYKQEIAGAQVANDLLKN